MLKRIIFNTLVFLTCVPMLVYASANSAARIGDNYYDNLSDAIANATSTDIIRLVSNVALPDTLTINKVINIDLNGKDISAPSSAFLVQGGALNVSGSGTIRETHPDKGVISVIGSSTPTDEKYSLVNIEKDVTLEGWSGISITHNSSKSYGVFAYLDGKINAISDTSGGVGIGIYVNGNIKDEVNAPVVNILDNAQIYSNGVGLYIAGYSTFNINSSYIQGKEAAIGIKSGILNIDGATVYCDGEDNTPTDGNTNGINPSGAAIQIESNSSYAGDIELNFSNGEFKSKNSMSSMNTLAKVLRLK